MSTKLAAGNPAGEVRSYSVSGKNVSRNADFEDIRSTTFRSTGGELSVPRNSVFGELNETL